MMILTYGAEPFLRSRQLCSYSTEHFMEPEGSLPCSQDDDYDDDSVQFIVYLVAIQ
jgi:hypothetical protein